MIYKEGSMNERWIVVTTKARGVFFGKGNPNPGDDPIHLEHAQMCVYWSRDVRGVIGLAASGPTADSRVTKPAPSMEVRGITAVIDCTPEAVEAWRSVPWGE